MAASITRRWACGTGSRRTRDAPLVLAWLASRTYPDAFADYPLEDTIREYYKTWYGYDVTDDELVQMLVY